MVLTKNKNQNKEKQRKKDQPKNPLKQSAFWNVKVNDYQNVWNMQNSKFIF